MSKVSITRSLLDDLAVSISAKSGEPVPMTLTEMKDAVDGISGGGVTVEPLSVTSNGTYRAQSGHAYSPVTVNVASPSLQTKTKTYTPTTTQQTETVTADSGYDGLDEVNITVNAIQTETKSATPSESAQTITPSSGKYLTSVSVGAIASDYIGSGITRRNSSDLIANGPIITVPDGYYQMETSKGVPIGQEGLPVATKGTVSNHSVSVEPSVTNTEGYIYGTTIYGTAVTVSASELVSGSETKTENGTYDVTNLAELVVDVQGGGGSTINVGKTTKTLATASSSIQFTGLSGNPTSFVVTSSADLSSGVTSVVFDGSSLHGQVFSTQATADTGFTKSYSSGTLTVTSSNSTFGANEYKLAYTYGGSASDIQTADVQVGSGATSITFPTLGRPVYWSCIFKSNFSTSQGYQRVMEVANDGTNTYGISLDSTANASTTYWSANYSGGNLVISSQSTNAGGYFHQPGYYQLTYAVDESAPVYQSKTVTPTTSQQTVTADSGYDALEEVIVNAMPSMTLPSSTSATSSGTSKATISASSSIQYLNIPTGYNATAQYYTISASGGGGSLTVATKTLTNTATAQTLSFSSLSGQPKYWFLRATTNVSSSGSTTYYYVTDCFYDGTNIKGNTFRIGSTRRVQNITSGISQLYSGGTLTITAGSSSGATPGQFYGASNFGYELVYIY